MSEQSAASDQGPALLALYDSALPEVYGYLMRRCDGPTVAEDLTAETFLAAVAAVRKGSVPAMTTAWLIGVARHKLVDHWRKKARDQRNLQAVADEVAGEVDPWDAHLDASVAHAVLGRLPGVTLYYRVTNMAAAVAKVRELGGTVVSEDTYGSGGNASCLDDQGVPFQLWRPAPGY